MVQQIEGHPNLNEVLQDPDSFSKPLEKLKSVYESLDLGDFNDEVLQKITAEGTESILSEYKSAITEEIDKSGIKSTRMRAIMLHGYDDAVIDLEKAVEALNEAVETRRREAIKARILSESLIMEACGFEKQWSESKNPNDLFKRLTIGRNSWISTKCRKSWSFKHSEIKYVPGKGDVYVYAMCPVSQSEPALLTVAYEPMPNTNTHYLVLMKTGDYSEVSFDYQNIL